MNGNVTLINLLLFSDLLNFVKTSTEPDFCRLDPTKHDKKSLGVTHDTNIQPT